MYTLACLLACLVTYLFAYMLRCLRAYAYMLTWSHAYMLTCVHAYMPTCLHACILTYSCRLTYLHTYLFAHLHTYTLTYSHTIHILGFLCFYSNFLRRSVSACHPFYLFFSPLGLSSVAGAHSVHSLWKQWDFVAQKLCSSRVQLINAVPINHSRSSHRWRVIWNHFHGNFPNVQSIDIRSFAVGSPVGSPRMAVPACWASQWLKGEWTWAGSTCAGIMVTGTATASEPMGNMTSWLCLRGRGLLETTVAETALIFFFWWLEPWFSMG